MPITNNTTKYFEGNNPISFRALSDTFGGSETDGSIRFSKYKRDTQSLDPVVPDATENINIPVAENNLSLEDYRGSIKQYDIEQSGTDENISFKTHFNNNLTKNVFKRLNISGTCYSTDQTKFAASLDAGTDDVLNIDLEVDSTGKIHGAGGRLNTNSGNGGGALYVETGSQSKNFSLNIDSSGQIWSGGGSGGDGSDGNSATGNCNQSRTVTGRRQGRQSYTIPGTTDTVDVSLGPYSASTNLMRISTFYANCRASCRSAVESGARCHNVRGANISGSDNLCRGTGGNTRGRGEACGNFFTYNCKTLRTTTNPSSTGRRTTREYYSITSRHTYAISASGGTKGTSGLGQGYGQTKTAGNPGNPGSSASCDSGWSGSSIAGNPGNPGTAGGDWGEDGGDGGGNAGAALSYGSGSITIRGKSSNTFKGKEIKRN